MPEVKAALDAIHPSAFLALIAVIVGAVIYAWRKLLPDTFEALPRSVQDLPAILVGALLGALSSGLDPIAAVAGAFSGVLAIGGHHVLKRSPLPYGNPKPEEQPRPRISFPPVMMLMLVSLASGPIGCGSIPVSPAVADAVDPMLRAIGFCREHGADVRDVVEKVKSGDAPGAALQIALVVQQLRDAGVQIPPEIDQAVVHEVAAVRSLEIGLRALDGRDADGNKLPLPPDPEPQAEPAEVTP